MALKTGVFGFLLAIAAVFDFTDAAGQTAGQSFDALATANDRSTGVMVRGIEAVIASFDAQSASPCCEA